MEAATTEIDGAISSASRSLAIGLFGDGGGSIGQLLADPATGTTFTLKQTDDITNFEVGMNVGAYSAATGGSVRAGGFRLISAVNRDTGVVTVSTAIDAAWLINDFIAVSYTHLTLPTTPYV